MNDNLFNRVERKTKVNKETILSLANKLQQGNMKDEKTLNEVINELSTLTGKEISKERKDKIIKAIIDDNVPKNIDSKF